MTTTGYSNYKINGTSLQTYAWNLETLSGLDGLPARRGSNQPTPYQDGDYSFGEKFYSSRTFALSMLIFAQDASGGVNAVDGPRYNLRKNIDDFKSLISSATGLQTFSFDVYDGAGVPTTRSIEVEIMVASQVEQQGGLVMQMTLELMAPRPFWRELPLIQHQELAITSFPHSFSLDTSGNAPIGDAVITVDANAAGSAFSLGCTSTNDLITVNDLPATNDQYVIDLGAKSFTKNGVRADSLIGRNTAWFLRLQPSATLPMNFSASSGNYDLQIDYYKKWL